ncbi:hypothetical protein [Effusibacillus consociatus]|uniref:NIPSNAP domain-containing protein n=1 Tax=Effusibacillus consociatus TaxID=1117041 RepID=A0ABV9Q433_9BACL
MGRVRGFFEYKIVPEQRESYLEWAAEFKRKMNEAGIADIEVLESNQRTNQFIETFTVESIDRFEAVRESLNVQPDYQELQSRLDKMLQGGRESMKIWFFSEI